MYQLKKKFEQIKKITCSLISDGTDVIVIIISIVNEGRTF